MQKKAWQRFGSLENLQLAAQQLQVVEQQINVCTRCPLHQTRTQGVPGTGPVFARIMAIGEAPGAKEDLQGKPFVGAAGQLLTKLAEGIGLSRDDIFITNVIKSRPPDNRDPLPSEVEACSLYLDEQIAIIKPDVILLLGRHAMLRLIPDAPPISQAHGSKIIRGTRVYIPLFHPAAALYNGSLLTTLQADMLKVKQYLAEIDQVRLT